jgi:hypothetical protein
LLLFEMHLGSYEILYIVPMKFDIETITTGVWRL